MDKSLVLVIVIFTFGWLVAIVVRSAHRARRSMAWWVVEQLSDSDRSLTFRVAATSRAWNPAKPPGVNHGVFGPGTATYRREEHPEGDLIHLDFVPKRGTTAQHVCGPIPDSALSGSVANARARRALPTIATALLAPFALLAGATLIAIVGASPANIAWVIGAGVVLALLPTLIGTSFNVAQAFRRTAQDARNEPKAPHAAPSPPKGGDRPPRG